MCHCWKCSPITSKIHAIFYSRSIYFCKKNTMGLGSYGGQACEFHKNVNL